MLLLALSSAASVQAKEPPVVAFICEQRNALPWIDVAEAALASDARIRLVDREHLDKVLAEQKLTALSAPDGGAVRIKIGKLVGCDILIMVRHEVDFEDVVRIAIADSHTGIRLMTAKLLNKNEAEMQYQPATLLAAALKKREIADPIILAIPPFTNDDLSRNNQFLQTSLATVCETVAARYPRILLVEFEEARELAKENTLTATATSRMLPHYLRGRFRLESGVQQPFASLNLERGNQVIAEQKKQSPTPEDIGGFVREAAEQLLASLSDKKAELENDDTADATQLAKQAREFFKIGDFIEGARLAEASLLLRPEQAELRFLLSSSYMKLADFYDRTPMDKQRFDQRFQRAMSYDIQGLRHLKIYLNAIKKPYVTNVRGAELFDFYRHQHADDKTRATFVQHRRDIREMFVEIILTKSQRGEHEESLAQGLLYPALSHFNKELDGPIKPYLTDRLRLVPVVEKLPHHQLRHFFYEKLLTDGIASHNADSIAFYESLTASDNKELATAAQQAIATAYRSMGRIPRVSRPQVAASPTKQIVRNIEPRPVVSNPKPRVPTPKPSNEPSVAIRKDISVQLTPVEITYSRDGHSAAIKLQGILSNNQSDEVAWGDCVVLRRNGNTTFEKIFEVDRHHYFKYGCFDGKYVWIPVSGINAQLLRIDASDGSVVSITPEHGLPNVRFVAAVTAPLEPGRIALVANFGQQDFRRAFVLEVTCKGETPPTVRVVHEAREELVDLDPKQSHKNVTTNTNLTYLPKFVLPLENNRATPTEILIGRSSPNQSGQANPLIVELPSGKASISPFRTHTHIGTDDIVIHDDAVHWMASKKIWRVTPDNPPKLESMASIEEDDGALYFLKEGVLIIGHRCWFTESLSKPFERVHSNPEKFPDAFRHSRFSSSTWGPLLKSCPRNRWTLSIVEIIRAEAAPRDGD
jgi:hypothetical protein